jgi:prephenate dehydratase
MKKITTTIAAALFCTALFAQTSAPTTAPKTPNPQVAAAPAAVVNIDAAAKFDKLEHNFGNIQEGPQATTEFKIKNIGKEPLIVKHVQASCGCTVPNWSKEPILPGKTGTISAVYNTQGRPGAIHKTLEVQTDKGVKTLTLSGNVERAAAGTPPPPPAPPTPPAAPSAPRTSPPPPPPAPKM